MERRLAAILAADMVGYSRLMEADEEGTIARQDAHRTEMIDPEIARHRGRIVKTMGDGLLIEFNSIVDAVRCAVVVQEAMRLREADYAGDERIAYRVGVNLGDIVIDGDDILGEGVNIAARLEGLAEPGGICISDIVYQSVKGKIENRFDDLGEQQVKNLTEPLHVHRIRLDVPTSEIGSYSAAPAALNLPDRPSIAVLPFDNMSGDPEQEYFADGIAEDIITGLSRMRWFFVSARNSSFTYKGRAVDIKAVSRELGVRYVLEGSVRKAGNRARITVQLIDATTGNHLWAERYDRELTDVFAVQDEITETVVATIEPKLYAAESERAKRKTPESLDAWDLLMQSMPHLWRMTGPDNTRAQELLQAAIDRDPGYAQAHGLLGFSYIWHAWMGWGEDPTRLIPEAASAARRAIELDEQDAWAHLVMGTIDGYARRHEDAIERMRKALELNPNFSFAYFWLGSILGYAGKVDEAIEAIDRAYRMSPRDPFNILLPVIRSIGMFTALRDTDTRDLARETIKVRPDMVGAWRMLTVSTAHLGELDEARRALAETKRLQPTISLAWARKYGPWVRPQDLERYVEGFRLAGLE
ncbi:MAG: adenylate/guanylate cyclase domain-containing protein [Alphaproteobacteria bacterium]|nr:adenylate/guanylate cyclase domain-containing protein [Alphaproteobacteria bacterium]